MSVTEIVLILLSGLGAGAINAVVGSGTLITFPTLVALGFPPVTATMSNAVGLIAGNASGTWGYRRELRGQGRQLRWQLPASLAGAVVGSTLLLTLPESAFETIVPVLLILALVLVVIGPRIQKWAKKRSEAAQVDDTSDADAAVQTGRTRMAVLMIGTFAVGIYGGYFTAAQGILLMGVMGALVTDHIQRQNAVKNVLVLAVNVVAALMYVTVAFDRINWAAAGLIAIGSLIGGALGAKFGRRLPPLALRLAIITLGLVGLWRLIF